VSTTSNLSEPGVRVSGADADAAEPDSLRRKPQQARSRARVARLLEAAERVLVTEGVPALTTTRVAAEAQVSVGSLYQYLPDRDAIVAALATTYLARLEDLMDALVAAAAAERWDDPVGTIVDRFAQLYRTAHGFRALWFAGGLNERTREMDRTHKTRMAGGVRRTLLALGLAEDTPELDHICDAAVLAADALIQEAFRRDPFGDPNLLTEAKVMLGRYLGDLRERHPDQR